MTVIIHFHLFSFNIQVFLFKCFTNTPINPIIGIRWIGIIKFWFILFQFIWIIYNRVSFSISENQIHQRVPIISYMGIKETMIQTSDAICVQNQRYHSYSTHFISFIQLILFDITSKQINNFSHFHLLNWHCSIIIDFILIIQSIHYWMGVYIGLKMRFN